MKEIFLNIFQRNSKKKSDIFFLKKLKKFVFKELNFKNIKQKLEKNCIKKLLLINVENIELLKKRNNLFKRKLALSIKLLAITEIV